MSFASAAGEVRIAPNDFRVAAAKLRGLGLVVSGRARGNGNRGVLIVPVVSRETGKDMGERLCIWNGLNWTIAKVQETRSERPPRKRKTVRSDNRTGYRGVAPHRDRFRASIQPPNGSSIHLGVYQTAVEAAVAYDGAALLFYGPQATLNFPGC